METAERAQHVAESVSFACCSQLAVCYCWLQHLLMTDIIQASPKLEKVHAPLRTVPWLLL